MKSKKVWVKMLEMGVMLLPTLCPREVNYMVSVECNGDAILGSPFPVFFSQGKGFYNIVSLVVFDAKGSLFMSVTASSSSSA